MPSRYKVLVIVSLLLTGCSDRPETSSTEVSPAGVNAAKTESSTSDSGKAETYEDLLVGLDLPGLPEAFAKARDAWLEDQTNSGKTVRFIDFVARLGQLHEENGIVEQSTHAFRTAEELIQRARDRKIDVPPVIEGIVSYHLACIAASKKDTATSLTLLNKAVDLGFSELDKIRNNGALTDVRALPEFAGSLEKWEKALKERALEAGRGIIAEGESFPFSFDLTDVEGKPLKLSDFQGRVCIVDIWGTWCGPCVKEIPSFVRLQDEFGGQGFQMIGLNSEHSEGASATAKVKEFMVTHGMNYPCALVTDEVLGQVPQLEALPTTLFIDHEGKVRARLVGVQPHERLEGILLALLEEKTAAEAARK